MPAATHHTSHNAARRSDRLVVVHSEQAEACLRPLVNSQRSTIFVMLVVVVVGSRTDHLECPERLVRDGWQWRQQQAKIDNDIALQ